ncbi:MAG TPA: hypothetical protein VLC91_17480 [Spongiibacteraceae bacterium]|nr:hypothetical protein [Spongiibacteraceae bacterium]
MPRFVGLGASRFKSGIGIDTNREGFAFAAAAVIEPPPARAIGLDQQIKPIAIVQANGGFGWLGVADRYIRFNQVSCHRSNPGKMQ